MVKVRLPASLQRVAQNISSVEVDATCMHEALEAILRTHPQLQSKLCNDKGEFRDFIMFDINQQSLRALKKENPSLKDGDVVSLIIPIAGG